MKINAISILERAYIIRQLAEHGKWEATRRRAHVRMFRFRTSAGTQVQFTVGRGPLNVNGQGRTVAEAVNAINELLAGGPRQPAPAPHIPVFARRTAEQWLPYKDA